MPLRIPVILGTVREGRKSAHVARYVHARLAKRRGMESPFVDPRELQLGDLVARAKDASEVDEAEATRALRGKHGPPLADFVAAMEAADAFIVVTPEYNFGYPGALKNLLDTTLEPWRRKPFGLVGCGGVSGGLRAIDNLRQVVAGVGAVAVPAHLPVPFVSKTFGPEGPLQDRESWERRVDRFLDEVLWYAEALKAARGSEGRKSDRARARPTPRRAAPRARPSAAGTRSRA